MGLISQVAFGSLLLGISTLIHVGSIGVGVVCLARLGHLAKRYRSDAPRVVVLLLFGALCLVVAHTIQIWLWAAVFRALGGFEDLATSFYFATVTYTTLGYGDIVPGEGFRVLATFAAITGLLTFGISTAFLIGLVGKVLPDLFEQ